MATSSRWPSSWDIGDVISIRDGAKSFHGIV